MKSSSRNLPPVSPVLVADALLRIGRPASLPQLIDVLENLHPDYCVSRRRVRCQLAAFDRSANCTLLVDRDARPNTYHMLEIHRDFFRKRDALEGTIIPARKSRGKICRC